MPREVKKGKSGNKKHGRSANWCLRYRNRQQRERNKLHRVRRHLRHHPNDYVAENCRSGLKSLLRMGVE